MLDEAKFGSGVALHHVQLLDPHRGYWQVGSFSYSSRPVDRAAVQTSLLERSADVEAGELFPHLVGSAAFGKDA